MAWAPVCWLAHVQALGQLTTSKLGTVPDGMRNKSAHVLYLYFLLYGAVLGRYYRVLRVQDRAIVLYLNFSRNPSRERSLRTISMEHEYEYMRMTGWNATAGLPLLAPLGPVIWAARRRRLTQALSVRDIEREESA